MSFRQIRLVLLCFAVQAWMTAVLRGEDEFPFFEAKIRPLLVNHCYECHLSLIHISEPTRPY